MMIDRTCFAVIAALALAVPLSPALASGVGRTFTIDGVVHTVCRAQLDGAASVVSPSEVDLGQMTELCNDGQGYQVVLNTPAGVAGQVVIDGAPPIQVAADGHTLIVNCDTDMFRHRELKLELAAGSPIVTSVSFTTSP